MSVPVKTPDFGPFWEKKFLSFHRKIATGGDGKIRRSDYEQMAARYVELGHLDGVKAKQVNRKLVQIWKDYLEQDATNGAIHELDFLRCVRDRKDRVLETTIQFLILFFDLIDLNANAVITKTEYTLLLKVIRVEDADDIEKAFDAVDLNRDGQISHDEFLYAGCEYFMSNDESLPSSYMFGPLI